MSFKQYQRTPGARYEAQISEPGFIDDPVQRGVVEELDNLFLRLCSANVQQRSLFERWQDKLFQKPLAPERGLYLWGGVGRGKTFLMDIFYDCLPFPNKLRMHFHHFMYRVQKDLTKYAGSANPLELIADGLAEECRVLCFDEFFVSDIGDAMVLGELLRLLFDRGVTLVATSNIPPQGLYKNGLQRARFLPAIALLEKYTRTISVNGEVDYRLRILKNAEIYHYPLDLEADRSLKASLLGLAPDKVEVGVDLEIEGRLIHALFQADDVVWFDFLALCDGPRSQNDYIEIARVFHAVLISNVPMFRADIEDQARRFISLIDEFYDRGVKLIISAEVAIEDLYRGERLHFEFERTQSRLLEMQSKDYLAGSHRSESVIN
ncbi:MAG: AFG1 family ATPase [Pseudomonadales bacterium]|nr:AFG1 family ATPase [Pseudomonadales bacterium]